MYGALGAGRMSRHLCRLGRWLDHESASVRRGFVDLSGMSVGEQGQFRAESAALHAPALPPARRVVRSLSCDRARARTAARVLLVSSGLGLACGGSGSDGHDWDALGDVSGGSGDVRPRDLDTPDTGRPGGDAGLVMATPVAATSELMTRSYHGECGPDARVQWGFLTYTAHTPGDSSITFRIRTADAEAALAAEPWSDLVVAQASPDTQSCTFFGPAPCPIDLYVALGGAPRAHHLFAEIALLFQPSLAGTPTLETWQINYSCPFTQ
jgi:hypothetical protein